MICSDGVKRSVRNRATNPHQNKSYLGNGGPSKIRLLQYRQPDTVFVLQMFVPENGRHGNALAVSFFRRRVRLRSCAHDFQWSIEKRCGKLGRYVSFTEIHVLYYETLSLT